MTGRHLRCRHGRDVIRALPADGWLRVLCTCVEIGQDWFDEDHIVVDRLGRIVVQTRQLAMVPAQ